MASAAALHDKGVEVKVWKLRRIMRENLVQRQFNPDCLIFHSDRGVQYSSMGYRTMLSENGITSSMSAPGCPYDNACMESFFASLKKEHIYR